MADISNIYLEELDSTYNLRDDLARHQPGYSHILIQPVSVSGKIGDKANFYVFAKETDATYTWYYSKTSGASWSKVVTAYQEPLISFDINTSKNGYMYKCLVSSKSGGWSEYSDVAILLVDASCGDIGRIKKWKSIGTLLKDDAGNDNISSGIDVSTKMGNYTELAIRSTITGTADTNLRAVISGTEYSILGNPCTNGTRRMFAIFRTHDEFGMVGEVGRYGGNEIFGSSATTYMNPFAETKLEVKNITSFLFAKASSVTTCKVEFFAR